jgi:hypothetical protein
MPGLLRGIARTAVVAGTATAVSNRVSRHQYNRWSQQEEAQYYQEPQQQYYQEPAPAPSALPAPTPSGEDRITQLTRLGELKAQGVLTDEEFAAEKARVLAQ